MPGHVAGDDCGELVCAAGMADDAASPPVRNHYPYAIHCSLLRFCGVDGARRFWQQNPLVRNGQPLPPTALAEHLMQAESSPLAWVIRAQSALEEFLLDYGVSVELFADSLLAHANGASFVPSHIGLTWIAPMLGLVFRLADPYRAVLKLCRLGAQLNSPGIIFRELAVSKQPDGERAITLLTTYRELWEGRFPGWDAPVFTLRMYTALPRALGLPPFGPVYALADARSAARVVAPQASSCEGGIFSIAGRSCGHLERFSAFCARHGWKMPPLGHPDPEVVVMDDDVRCERRNRVVLARGCAYGSPGYIFTLHWHSPRKRPRDYLQHLIDEALAPERAIANEHLRALHAAFMGAAKPARCRYVARENAIYINDTYLCKGVAALVLLHCLRARVADGKSNFTFREFKSNEALISHPKNTGFEVRLQRLAEALRAGEHGLRIDRAGRGRFVLRCDAEVTLEEVP